MADTADDKFIKALTRAIGTAMVTGFPGKVEAGPTTGTPYYAAAKDIACLIPAILTDVVHLDLSYGVLLEGAYLDNVDRAIIENLLSICSRVDLHTLVLYRPYIQRLEFREFNRSIRFQFRVYRPGRAPNPDDSKE